MDQGPRVGHELTVGRLAELVGTTVRTLHHYDRIGLLVPGGRTAAGYRVYTDEDVVRLRSIVVYRRLGFALEEIAQLLDDPRTDVLDHLRRQRAAVESRLDELHELVQAIDRAMEAEMTGIRLTPKEQRELFGDGFSEDLAREAEDRWGDTDAWRQSRDRTARYTRDDWVEVTAESEQITRAFVEAMTAGLPPASEPAMDAAEAARQQIRRRFYDLTPSAHRRLGDMYLADPRFTRTYEDVAPGLARYVRDAIHANADRFEAGDRG